MTRFLIVLLAVGLLVGCDRVFSEPRCMNGFWYAMRDPNLFEISPQVRPIVGQDAKPIPCEVK